MVPFLGAALAFAAVFLSLALAGGGLPLWLAALIAAACVGLVLRAFDLPRPGSSAASPEAEALRARLDSYRAEVSALRHDLRGVLSPAMMMTDRLLSHEDPAVQRAGAAVVRSIERATALLASNKGAMATPDAPAVAPDPPAR